MKKKIHPKDQTEELNRARIEFLMRNPEEQKRIDKLIERNNKKRDEITTDLATINGELVQELKDSWDFLLREHLFDEEFRKVDEGLTIYPAAKAGWPWLDFVMENAYRGLSNGEKNIHQMDRDEMSEKYLDYLCRNARNIFIEMTSGKPLTHMFVGIDLTRTKEAILAEVAEIVTLHKIRTGITETEKKRLKWLPVVNELLEVWDLWNQAGQKPWQRTMTAIAKRVGRPTSTVKAQWRMAYEMIYNKPYDPQTRYSTEESKERAEDILCSKCPYDAKCYKKNGDWFPCADYRKIAGKERSFKTVQYNDEIIVK